MTKQILIVNLSNFTHEDFELNADSGVLDQPPRIAPGKHLIFTPAQEHTTVVEFIPIDNQELTGAGRYEFREPATDLLYVLNDVLNMKHGTVEFNTPHELLQWFTADHLGAEDTRDMSNRITMFARVMNAMIPAGREKSAAMRHLLEAKDAFIRAVIEGRKE